MSDFKGEDYDFAAGSIHGMRSWGIDDKGRLHGVTHAEVWRPGENLSVCKKTSEIPCPNPVAPRDHLPKGAATVVPRKKRKRGYEATLAPWERSFEFDYKPPARCGEPTCYDGRHTVPANHSFDPDCDCGFWAYDEHTFSAHGDITGIIEGYGKTTIGTRGFRCEKARIAALCRTRDGKPLSLSLWLRLQQLYPDAKFYEDRDEMVSAHGGVLHEWAAIDEGFWLMPVERPREDPYGFAALSRAMRFTVPSMTYSFGGSDA